MKKILVPIVILLLLGSKAFAIDAVVGIYSELGSKQGQGTGFFISETGDIITAYHVIQGASNLTVFYRGQRFTDITVVHIRPETDLAHIKINGMKNLVPFYYVDDNYTLLGLDHEVTAVGYLRGIPNQTMRGNFTSSSPIKSGQIRDNRNLRLFNIPDVDLLPLDLTIYGGLSGGPVLVNNNAVGVLSGSLNEGGSFTWAIPVAYRKDMQKINRRPHEITNWPALSLMNNQTWDNLRSSSKIDNTLNRLLDKYYRNVDRAKDAYEQAFIKLQNSRSVLQLSITMVRQLRDQVMPATTHEQILSKLELIFEAKLLTSLKIGMDVQI